MASKHLPECECAVCRPPALVCYLDDWRPWLAARQAKRRQPLPPRPPAVTPEDEVLELRVEVAELRKQAERLIREVARKDGERNPLPASWGGPVVTGAGVLTEEQMRELLALAEADERAAALGKGA